MYKKYLLLAAILLVGLLATAQERMVKVKNIQLQGLKKCKEGIVLRELDFAIGDSISMQDINERFARNEQYLLNSRLFLSAKLNIGEWTNGEAIITIDLKENWYIYAFPYVEYADRNFNVWWVEHGGALNRLNIGGRLYHENLTGNADKLNFVVQFGYAQLYGIKYQLPYINKQKTWGMEVSGLHRRQRETGYDSVRDTLRFFRDDDNYTHNYTQIGVAALYRPGLFSKQIFKLEYTRNEIADTIAALNPDFLLSGKTQQNYLSLSYEYQLDRRDIRAYPLNGWLLEGWVQKDGLGVFNEVNHLFADVSYSYYTPLNKKISLENIIRGRKVFFTNKLPYYELRRAIGYQENYLRGYEYYVIDGQDFMYLKNSLRYLIIDRDLNWGKAMPLKAMRTMPLKIYGKIHTDVGYVQDRFENSTSALANDWLVGWGVGVDFVVYHNFVVQFEYSFNHLLEKGLYLHFNFGFE